LTSVTPSHGYPNLSVALTPPKNVAQYCTVDFVLQVESSAGPLKAVLIDSVSAVLSPLLGGRQSEGEP